MCRFSRFSGSAKCTAYSIGKFFLNSNVFNSRNSGHSLLSSFGIVPGLFQFTSPGTFALLKSRDDRTTGTSRSLGPVLSHPVPGPSQDFLGRDSPVAITISKLLKLTTFSNFVKSNRSKRIVRVSFQIFSKLFKSF